MEMMDEDAPSSLDQSSEYDNLNTDEEPFIVKQWLEKFEKNTLTGLDFKLYWKKVVPKIYGPEVNRSCLNWMFNERLAEKLLFNTIEEFICAGDPKIVLSCLTQKDKPPSVCGRVFKMGEPTYSCRECGMDNTCVLCVDCFKNSQHRFHKYKMGTSGGGGCCDCGDVEAWKNAPFCNIHAAGIQSDNKNIQLPDDLKIRCRIAFDAVLWYCYHLLNTEQIADLRFGEVTDTFFNKDLYCTVLYNDEVHTFEQVISTLTRVKLCSQRTAIEFVTNIDREGRAVVKCSTFHSCSELKQEIEKYTSRHGNKALKVVVSHAYIVGHQIFALKLLTWCQNFLSHGEGFRKIFAEVVLEDGLNEPCIVKGILMHDSTLWKSARSQWQRLLISGMLLEYENKKQLAKIFTKNYGSVMKDFIKDDHDHSYSIASLAVQLFTVPTLAHHLIAYDDVLFILLNTFMSECSVKCNKFGKLEFERSPTSHSFKRAQYMLYDLRYLLSSIPEHWTNELRRNFLHGLSILLNLLSKMQGMDAVTRQIGQHMEYEPEWESAFNLHIKLAYCISLAIKWCSTDKIVLIKAYRSILKKLEENPINLVDSSEVWDVMELVDHSVACLEYDVSTKPVSIHLPLSRFLAGLNLHLEKFDLDFDSNELQLNKLSPVQIMEPVLRAQVMVAQVHAGMWRRNGYALLNQLYYYHNVKCRTEMLDRDIILLQLCASLIESNEFIIHLLNKFNLINWAQHDYESANLKVPEDDSIRQIICLVEEFLQLLIVIIGERYIPGISNCTIQDRIKKEIIQYLCIKPLPHSELNKLIPDDIAHDTALDDVIEELAIFKKPTQSSGKGVYELKDQYYDDYNVFFYHYTREELSKSEETQRRRRKNQGKLECSPPPKLLKLTKTFNMLVNLLQCDVMLYIMKIVLERSINLRSRTFSELQLHKILYLIGYALLEEETKNYPFFKFIQNSKKFKIIQLLIELVDSPRVDSHKTLIKWTIKKFRDIANQKDNYIISNEQNEISNYDCEKERRAKLAAERRAKIMEQMTAMQNTFMKENAKLFEESNIENNSGPSTSTSTSSQQQQQEQQQQQQQQRLENNEMEMEINEQLQTIALGPNQTTKFIEDREYICILCQEETNVNENGQSMVLAGFVQLATVLCQFKTNDFLDVNEHYPLFLNSNLGPAPYTSTCGHVMHYDCWRKYFDNVVLREHRRPYRLRHPASFDVDKQEFLCPLCECLSNTVLPLVPPLSTFELTTSATKININYDDWLNSINIILQKKTQTCHGNIKCNLLCPNLHCNACLNRSNGTYESEPETYCEVDCLLRPHEIFYVSNIDTLINDKDNNYENFSKLFTLNYPQLSTSLKETIQLFAEVTYTHGLNITPNPNDNRLNPITWKSLSYTLHVIELLIKKANKPLMGNLSSRQRDCIENLIRIVGVLGCTWENSLIINNYALHLLSILIEHPLDGPSILEWDSLGILISLTFSLPSLASKEQYTPIPSGGTMELYTLRTIFIAHIIKILIQMDINKLDNSIMNTDNNENNKIYLILDLLKINVNDIDSNTIWNYIKNCCLSFLRCCCLFYHYLTDVPASPALLELDGDTFTNMCLYLDLPQTANELFNSNNIIQMIGKWSEHKELVSYRKYKKSLIPSEPPQIKHLIDLPLDYSDLINTVSTYTCPNSDEVSRNPTMCLVCGKILCSQTYCCQTELNDTNVGACNYHAYFCGSGVGIFLRVRECEVLLLATPHRGCFISPPYIDNYGETDQGLRRGNPLRLCPERYKKLQTLWLSHSIHEEIARAIEPSSHIVTTQWNHL